MEIHRRTRDSEGFNLFKVKYTLNNNNRIVDISNPVTSTTNPAIQGVYLIYNDYSNKTNTLNYYKITINVNSTISSTVNIYEESSIIKDLTYPIGNYLLGRIFAIDWNKFLISDQDGALFSMSNSGDINTIYKYSHNEYGSVVSFMDVPQNNNVLAVVNSYYLYKIPYTNYANPASKPVFISNLYYMRGLTYNKDTKDVYMISEQSVCRLPVEDLGLKEPIKIIPFNLYGEDCVLSNDNKFLGVLESSKLCCCIID